MKKTEIKAEIRPARIVANDPVAQGVYRLALAVNFKTTATAGRFVNLYLNSKDKLLPRPFGICIAEKERLTLVYAVVGEGTKELAGYQPGTALRISTPLGNGYDLDLVTSGQKALLVGGGLGVPPLLALARELREKGVAVEAALGFRNEPILLNEFEALGVKTYVATEDGSHGEQGTVMDVIGSRRLSADSHFACGPRPLLREIAHHCTSSGTDVQVSMEERMGCGYGACLSCTCKTFDKEGNPKRLKICKDGPVLWGSEVDWDDK